MMNIFKPLVLTTAICSTVPWGMAAPTAGTPAHMRWQANGQIESGQLRRKIDLRGITAGLQNGDGLWLAGYRKNRAGEFVPMVVLVAPGLKNAQSWPFKNSVQQFFTFEHDLYALDIAGAVFLRAGEKWQNSRLAFKPGSSVVWAQDFLIACRPTPDSREPLWRGSCYSPQKKWEVMLDWRDKQPVKCGQWLVAVEAFSPPVALQIDPENGKVVKKVVLKQDWAGGCGIKF